MSDASKLINAFWLMSTDLKNNKRYINSRGFEYIKIKHSELQRIAKTGHKFNLGKKHSEETKKKISEAKKGRVFTEEHIKNRTKAQTGLKRSEEIKEKMRKPKSAEHALKVKIWNQINKINLGKKASAETKKKISENNIGKIPWNKGKVFSTEEKEKYYSRGNKQTIC